MKKSRFTRLAAIVLAAATLWVTAVTAGADSLRSAIAAVRDSARLPVALLRWELGDTFPVDALALPAMLALRESPAAAVRLGRGVLPSCGPMTRPPYRSPTRPGRSRRRRRSLLCQMRPGTMPTTAPRPRLSPPPPPPALCR